MIMDDTNYLSMRGWKQHDDKWTRFGMLPQTTIDTETALRLEEMVDDLLASFVATIHMMSDK